MGGVYACLMRNCRTRRARQTACSRQKRVTNSVKLPRRLLSQPDNPGLRRPKRRMNKVLENMAQTKNKSAQSLVA